MAEDVKLKEAEESSKPNTIARDIIWVVTGFILGVAATWCIMAATLSSTLKELDTYINQQIPVQVEQATEVQEVEQ